MKNVFISAFNIHAGGGYVLLEDFFKISKNIFFLLDYRIIKKKLIENFSTEKNNFVKKKLFNRIFSFIFFCMKANKKNSVFISFNGLPPLFRLKCKTILFIQSVYFVEDISQVKFYLKLRILFERIWFRFGVKNCDEFWVQTETMKKKLKKYFIKNKMIKINLNNIFVQTLVDKKSFLALKKHFKQDNFYKLYFAKKNKVKLFFYPADESSHKNHINLIKGFNSLDRKLEWRLILTINPEYLNNIYIKNNISYEVRSKIINFKQIDRSKVIKTLGDCDALIFPSVNESFGLPLLESCLLKKPVLASNEDYVFDILKNPNSNLLFNCFSYKSIANKINYFINSDKIRYSYQLNSSLNKFCNSSDFIKRARI